jgi:hypothetical protein
MLKEFVAGRTQKHFDLKHTYLVLNKYVQHYLENNDLIIEILLILIPIRGDYAKKLSVTHMQRDLWLDTFSNIEAMLSILSVPANREKPYQTYQKEEDLKYYSYDHVIESISTFFYSLSAEINKAF